MGSARHSLTALVRDYFSELYYVNQRQWDHFEAFFAQLKRDNPGIVFSPDAVPKRPEIDHLKPSKVFSEAEMKAAGPDPLPTAP